MKYTIRCFWFLCFSLLLFSCAKDSLESIPVEQSFEPPQEALTRYFEQLGVADYGWEFGLATKNDTYFAGYLDFSGAAFLANTHAPGDVALKQLTYTVHVSDQQPVLSFSSGTFAQFAAGRTGVDTAFTFQAARQDSIFLLGNRHGSQLILTRASLQQAEGYRNGTILHTLEQLDNIQLLPRYFKRLVVNGAEYDLHFRADLQTLYIHYGGTERFKIHETLYAPTATGVSLQKPLVDGINVISYLDALEVDPGAGTLTVVTNGISRTFTNEYDPSAYDMTATQAFNNLYSGTANFSDGQGGVTQERFTYSLRGFTVAGTADAYGMSNISGYQYMAFFHQFTGETYGGLMFVLNNQLNPLGGPALVKIYSTDGGFIGFVRIGSFSGASEDPNVVAIVDQVTTTLTDSYGFMVVSAGAGNYDLVSRNVTGGQKWIRFQ